MVRRMNPHYNVDEISLKIIREEASERRALAAMYGFGMIFIPYTPFCFLSMRTNLELARKEEKRLYRNNFLGAHYYLWGVEGPGEGKKFVPVDFHHHFQTSPDISKISYNQIVDIVKENIGEDAIIGITNFRDKYPTKGFRDDNRYEDFAQKIKTGKNYGNFVEIDGLRFIKVQEIPAIYDNKEVHLLAVGLEEGKHIEPREDLRKTIDTIVESNALLILDHPFSRAGIGSILENDKELSKFVLSKIDAIEIFNGFVDKSMPGLMPSGANKKARDYFYKIRESYPHVGAIVGSDGQTLSALESSSYNILALPKVIDSAESMISGLKEGIHGRELNKYDNLVSQPRINFFKHAFGMIEEEGLGNLVKRFF